MTAQRQSPTRPAARFRQLLLDPLALLSALLLLAIILLGLAAPVLPLAPPNAVSTGDRLTGLMTPHHPLGTDDLGRDILSRLIWGTRPSLAAGLLATAGALLPGVVIGLLAGYFGRWSDLVSMRLIDVLVAFPPLLLAIALVAGLGPGLLNTMLAVSIVGIPTYARLVRSQVLAIREMEFIEAARVLGGSDGRIIIRHILPNVLSATIVVASLDVGTKIIVTGSLSFLGLGMQPPDPDWGSMLARGRGFLTTAPHVATLPGLAIVVCVLTLNLIGDTLRDLLDPRIRQTRSGGRQP